MTIKAKLSPIFDSDLVSCLFWQFHFVINLAVGGYFFPDVRNKNGKRPWNNPADPTAMKEFWYNRNQWLSSWMTKERTSLIIDDIKVYAI